MKKVRIMSIVTVVLALLMIFSACNTNNSEDVPVDSFTTEKSNADVPSDSTATEENNMEVSSDKDTLVIGLNSKITTLDPQQTNTANGYNVLAQIYDTLFVYDKYRHPQPSLVESYTANDDRTVYTFNLKKGVLFTNGNELTSDDVVYTFEKAKTSPYLMDSAKKYTVDAIDDYTFTISLEKPSVAFFNDLAGPGCSILNREACEAEGVDLNRTAVGTGPYKLKEMTDQQIILETNTDYYGGTEYKIKNISFLFITDPNTLQIALQSGDIDLATTGVQSSAVATIKADESFKVLENSNINYCYLDMNTTKAPFDNLLVRQAIAYAINKDDIVSMAESGAAVVTDTIAPEGIFGHDPSIKGYEYDPTKAKELLIQAGYPDGFECTLSIFATNSKTAEVLQNQMAAVGITVTVETLDIGAFVTKMMSGQADIDVMNMAYSYPDAFGLMQFLYKSDSMYNWNFNKDTEIDALINETESSSDDVKRQQAFTQILQYVNDNAIQIPLFFKTTNACLNKDLHITDFALIYYVKDIYWTQE